MHFANLCGEWLSKLPFDTGNCPSICGPRVNYPSTIHQPATNLMDDVSRVTIENGRYIRNIRYSLVLV
jgi:hypothetical protein